MSFGLRLDDEDYEGNGLTSSFASSQGEQDSPYMDFSYTGETFSNLDDRRGREDAKTEIPPGWTVMESRSRPGKVSYMNMFTGERTVVMPVLPAKKEDLSFEVRVLYNDQEQLIKCGEGEQSFKWLAMVVLQNDRRFGKSHGLLRQRELGGVPCVSMPRQARIIPRKQGDVLVEGKDEDDHNEDIDCKEGKEETDVEAFPDWARLKDRIRSGDLVQLVIK